MAVHYTARIPARAFGFESDETIPGFLPIEQQLYVMVLQKKQ